MSQVKVGDTVKVHYTGRLDDGTVFDSSAEREPLEFTTGQHEMIPGFEKAVVGMALGESKTVRLEPGDAYGPYQEDQTVVVERNKVPKDVEPKVGSRVMIRRADGTGVPVTITEVTDRIIRLDANHPLAGKPLTFEIKLMEIA